MTQAEGKRSSAHMLSRVGMAIVATVVVLAGAGYWWLNRPPEKYRPDNSGLYLINVNGKFGYMDRSGRTVIAPQFDEAHGFSEGRAHVRIGSKSGYISTKGVIVITPQFDDGLQFQHGRAAVKLCCGRWSQSSGKDTFGFIDKDGKFISSPTFSWVGSFSGGFAPVKTANGSLAFVDRDGRIVPSLSGKFEMLSSSGFVSGFAPARSGGKLGFIDTTGKWVIDPQFEAVGNFADGLAAVRVGGRSGFVDKHGKFVINPQYDWCDDFYESHAIVRSAGEFSFIDTKGRVLGGQKFLAAGHFQDGLAPVQSQDGWGYIDQSGKLAVSPQFDSAEAFQNGLARVTVAGKEAYITTAGSFVVDPFPGTDLKSAVLASDLTGEWKDDEDGVCMRISVLDWPSRFVVKTWVCRTGEVTGIDVPASAAANRLEGADGELVVERVSKYVVTGKFRLKAIFIRPGGVQSEETHLSAGRFRKVRAGENEFGGLSTTRSDAGQGSANRAAGFAAAKMLASLNPNVEVVRADEGTGKITLREKKTGKNVTLDFQDIQKGRISFEDETGERVDIQTVGEGERGSMRVKTSEGSMQWGAGSLDDVPGWVPKFPGAKMVGSFTSQGKGQEGGSFQLRCDGSVQKVADYYEQALKGAGMQVEKHTVQAESKSLVMLTGSATAGRNVTASVTSTGEGTVATIIYGTRE